VQEHGLQWVLWHVLAPSAEYMIPRSGRDGEKRQGMAKNAGAGIKEKPAGIALPVFL